jgi:hypothetical protein
MPPAKLAPFAPLPIAWAPGEQADLRIWAVVVGLGMAVLAAELVRLGLRARRDSRDSANRQVASGPIANPALGVVPLDLEPKEGNRHDARYSRFVGPFRDDQRTGERPAMPWRRVACPPLRGRVVLVSLFVGADGVGWSEEEVARHLAALDRAARWMEQEAGRYGASLGVGTADVYFQVDGETTPEVEMVIAQSGGEVGLFEADMTVRALTLMSRAAAELGFRDAVDFVQEVAARLPGATPAWLLHLRLAGRSFAVPLDRTELDGVGLAFCHARQANFTEPLIRPPAPRAAVLAHEVLHLFGAQDKYGWPLSHFPPRSVTRRDVMRLDTERLSELRVDPLTAGELGWTS